MKKIRVLTLILVISIMLVGAGYAYWTQELNINTTVSTGELKVEFVPLDQGLYKLDDLIYEGLTPDDGDYEVDFWKNYMSVDVDLEEDRLVANFEDVYPGAGGFIRFRIANTGTVPATVTGILADPHGNGDLLDKFDYRIHSLRVYTPIQGSKIVGYDFSNREWIRQYFSYIDLSFPNGVDLIEADTFDDFVSELEAILSQYTLEPYAFFEINGEGTGYDILLPHDIKDEDLMENIDAVGFDLDITFTQGE